MYLVYWLNNKFLTDQLYYIFINNFIFDFVLLDLLWHCFLSFWIAEWPDFPRNFSFRENADTEHLKCVLIYERADYDEWMHYFFCSEGERDTEMRWSDSGQIRGRWKCTNIFEPREAPSKSWVDNYLCVPKNAPYNFTWVQFNCFEFGTCAFCCEIFNRCN